MIPRRAHRGEAYLDISIEEMPKEEAGQQQRWPAGARAMGKARDMITVAIIVVLEEKDREPSVVDPHTTNFRRDVFPLVVVAVAVVKVVAAARGVSPPRS